MALGVDGDPDAGPSAALSDDDRRMSAALRALYGDGDAPEAERRSAGLGRSAPSVARWLGDVRRYFPSSVVSIVQRDAFERLGLRRLLLEPEILSTLEPDVALVADLISLRAATPEAAKGAAREVVAKLVDDLSSRLRGPMESALRGAMARRDRTRRPKPQEIDWRETIQANLRHYQPDRRTVIPERLLGRRKRRRADLDEVVLCVDQSGSMAASVVYASIFAAVMASLPTVRTRLVCFDVNVMDLTEDLNDPVDALFSVQLGGGTDINQAIAYCESRIERPAQTHLILISDLFEGGREDALLGRLERLCGLGVGVIALLALSDDGRPAYVSRVAASIAAMTTPHGPVPVFACTPDQFPDLMAAALAREDLSVWAAERDVALVRPQE